MNEDGLIRAIQLHLQSPSGTMQEARRARPPVTPEEMDFFEQQIPYALPGLFKRVYLEIGDGGWGPWNGLCPLGVRGDENDPHFSVLCLWKFGNSGSQSTAPLLSFCDGGCTIFSVLDLKTGCVGLDGADDIGIRWQASSLHE